MDQGGSASLRTRGGSLAVGRVGAPVADAPPRCEGMLQKWTNYVSGWQPRFVVLADGTLSYYLSRSEALQSSRASINVASATVKVHPTDGCRFDIETAYIALYFRAASISDRQRWLVALGSTKARSEHGKVEGVQSDSTPSRQRGSSSNALGGTHSRAASLPEVSLDDARAELATCRLIMETQALSLDRRLGQLAAQLSPLRLSPAGAELLASLAPGDSIADEALVLSATCNTFLQALADCVRLLELQEKYVAGGAAGPTVQRRGSANSLRDVAAVDASRGDVLAAVDRDAQGGHVTQGEQGATDKSAPAPSPPPHEEPPAPAPPPGPPTFFSGMTYKFSELRVTSDGIPTEMFLKCCSSMLPILDVLGSTAFAPVKADINGNIRKLQGRFDEDPVGGATLELMVRHEIMAGTTTARNSATDALLWLKRALEFISQFLVHVLSGEGNLGTAASKAYETTLSKYHGWIVRGVFSLAMRAVPTKEAFFAALGPSEAVVVGDMAAFAGGLAGVISALASFYHDNNLDSNARV